MIKQFANSKNFLQWTKNQNQKLFNFNLNQNKSSLAAAHQVKEEIPECPFSNVRSNVKDKKENLDKFDEIEDTIVEKNVNKNIKIKSIDQMPGPSGIAGWKIARSLSLFLNGGGANLHEYGKKNHLKYGPIYKEKLDGMNVVFISDPDYSLQLRNQEGKIPIAHARTQPTIQFLKTYPEKRTGMTLIDGEQWYNTRKWYNGFMVKQNVIPPELYTMINDTISNILEGWVQKIKEGDFKIENLYYPTATDLMGSVMFGRRWKLHRENIPKSEYDQFNNMKFNFFKLNTSMMTIPPWLFQKIKHPIWRQFENDLTGAFNISDKWTKSALNDINTRTNPPISIANDGLNYFFKGVSHSDENFIHFKEFLLFASNTLSEQTYLILYALARHPEVQEKVYKEISRITGGERFSFEHLDNAEFLRNSVKEGIRMYPTATYILRYLSEENIIGNYKIPPNTLMALSLYVMHRSPKYFSDPDKYFPERWERKMEGGRRKALGVENALAYQPFGLGKRGCIGKKVANNMLGLFFGRLVQNFKLECDEAEFKMKTVLTLDRPINLKLTPRRS